MKRIRIVGVCLVAACAFSVVMVASASALAPEFGRCINIAPKVGKFKTEACTVCAQWA